MSPTVIIIILLILLIGYLYYEELKFVSNWRMDGQFECLCGCMNACTRAEEFSGYRSCCWRGCASPECATIGTNWLPSARMNPFRFPDDAQMNIKDPHPKMPKDAVERDATNFDNILELTGNKLGYDLPSKERNGLSNNSNKLNKTNTSNNSNTSNKSNTSNNTNNSNSKKNVLSQETDHTNKV